MGTTRRVFAISLAAGPFARVLAQENYPDRPIRLVVPSPPGGPSDLMARLLADGMRPVLQQPIAVDNRTGAAGLIGTAAVAQAAPDGYTVLLTTRSNHVMAPLVNAQAPVNPSRELASIGLAVRSLVVLATSGKTGFKSLGEFIAAAKANPGKLSYGSAGVGATNHIGVEQFKSVAGVDLLHVPYRGSGPLITALMSGEVQLAMLDYASSQAAIKAGSLVALAQSAKSRYPTASGIPTLNELGFGAADLSFWLGMSVPRATPGPIVEKLNAAMNAALRATTFRAYAQANAWEVVGGAPSMLDQAIQADLNTLPALIKKLNIQAN